MVPSGSGRRSNTATTSETSSTSRDERRMNPSLKRRMDPLPKDISAPKDSRLHPGEEVNSTRYRRSANDAAQTSNQKGKATISLDSLGFGCMVRPKLMHVMKSIRAKRDVRLEIDIQESFLALFFSYTTEPTASNSWATSREFKSVIRISSIEAALEADESEWRHLVLSLPHPPEYFRKSENVWDTFERNSQRWAADRTWCRATNILQDNEAQNNLPVALHDDLDESHINIGRWTAFRLSFHRRGNDSAYRDLQSALWKGNVFRQPNCEFDTSKAVSAWDYLDHPSTGGASQPPSALLALGPVVHLDFKVRYQLDVCISRGLLCEYTIGIDFLQRLAAIPVLDATRRLEYLADRNERLSEPMDLFEMEDAEFYFVNVGLPGYCAYVRKASITPTTILLSSPVVETSNRILRYYSRFQDRFLRVQFLGESESGRIQDRYQENEDIWKRVRRTLTQGIRVGSHVYKFLAFGNSQLRECGAYFFCPTDHVSCDDILAWMGQFDHIRVVAKYGARLGQCFSTTREIRGVPVPEVKYIPDIEQNGMCFTDGSGLISKFLAQAITRDMKLNVMSEPTAFQIRMGGIKGVVSVWPQVEWGQVHIRPSQEKFKSSSQSLEVIKCASRATATLNRQTITILESLGVHGSVFRNLLCEQIKAFENAARDTRAAIALLTRFVDENQNSLVLAELLKARFKTDGEPEPFACNLLNLWMSWSFKMLREKAHIHVAKSAFLLGCADESGTLRGHSRETEGSGSKDVHQLPQIFLQLTDPSGNAKTVIEGVCIVGRNPSLHPGDIRVVQAVDNPKLRHLTDVVVFPTTGDRPVPSMLSGGDLDGDDFFVIWDSQLIPSEWNYPPMDYEGPKPQELDRDVVTADLQEFFVNYMKNDVLGLIATSHLGFADKYGPKSPKCIELAEKASRAVDYPKTGEPANFEPKDQLKIWPHFMEKRRCYHSNKALGAIFDKVVKHSTRFDPSWEHAFDKRITERFEIDGDTREKVKATKLQYDICVRRLLAQHEVGTEFELYTGWCMSRPRIGSDYKRQESLGHEYGTLKQRFREQCYNLLEGDAPEHLERFVAAMYVVTEEEVKAALQKEKEPVGGEDADEAGEGSKPVMPLISFPWIFHWVLVQIAMGKSYKPGKALLAAARRMPAVNHEMQSPVGDPPWCTEIGATDGKASVKVKDDMAKREGNAQGESSAVEATKKSDSRTNHVDVEDEDEDAEEEQSLSERSKVDLAADSAVDRLIALMGVVE